MNRWEEQEDAFNAYCKRPLEVLQNTEHPWIEDAICHALRMGGWEVEPGDGCGIVANMIRDAAEAAHAAGAVEEREHWFAMDQDDFERATCGQEGEAGHFLCGWCPEHDKPRFQCGCLCDKDKAKIAAIRNRT